jgi:CRP-like cAMP-binding protein
MSGSGQTADKRKVYWSGLSAKVWPLVSASSCAPADDERMDHTSNLLLSSLAPSDSALLQPHLKPYEFKPKHVLFEAREPITAVYFPFNAIVSLVVMLSTGEAIEAAMVGRDGVVGASAALDGRISLSRGITQIPGVGVFCELEHLKRIAFANPSILSLLIRHEQTVYAQAQQSAACNATHSLEARLARWLARARDLAGSESLPFTQEFLAEMLGVRRTSVSLIAHTLQQTGIIQYRRGNIKILNVEGLHECACECYETVKLNYKTLLGQQPN